MMKIILYAWGSNLDNGLKQSLTILGHDVVIYDRKCTHYTRDLKMAHELIELIHESNAEAIISYDYYPIISMVCNTSGIMYYSWVYDCPHYTLFAKTAAYECNRIGCFDRELVERMNRLGTGTVFHHLLGVEWPDVSCTEAEKYRCDVSFVGSLYTDKYNYYDAVQTEEWFKERAGKYIEKQCFDYKKDYTGDFFKDNSGDIQPTTDIVRNTLRDQDLLPGEDYIEDVQYIFASSFLEKKVTIEERKRLLTRVAEEGYDLRLYTGSDLTGAPVLGKYNKGYVDYDTIMPYVFRHSRINLNITLRSIKTGIPLRALDIMGCGGFLLSNYQQELAEQFEEGREMVLFYSLEDCIDKISYYLTHEDERSKIAKAGCNAVRERFDRSQMLERLISS